MNNQLLAERIYNALVRNGVPIGNASIGIIRRVLDTPIPDPQADLPTIEDLRAIGYAEWYKGTQTIGEYLEREGWTYSSRNARLSIFRKDNLVVIVKNKWNNIRNLHYAKFEVSA